MSNDVSAPAIGDLVFVGFNSRIAAMHRDTGALCWQWKSPRGSGFVTVLLDGDRLIASVRGYTYCLDPRTGEPLWDNPLPGFGTGVPCIATARGSSMGSLLGEAAAAQARASTHGASAARPPV